MTTAETIIARLPQSPTVTPMDVAAAAGFQTATAVINAIQSGLLDAVKIGGRYIISRECAAQFIRNASKEASK